VLHVMDVRSHVDESGPKVILFQACDKNLGRHYRDKPCATPW
jgi:hypothetical protein